MLGVFPQREGRRRLVFLLPFDAVNKSEDNSSAGETDREKEENEKKKVHKTFVTPAHFGLGMIFGSFFLLPNCASVPILVQPAALLLLPALAPPAPLLAGVVGDGHPVAVEQDADAVDVTGAACGGGVWLGEPVWQRRGVVAPPPPSPVPVVAAVDAVDAAAAEAAAVVVCCAPAVVAAAAVGPLLPSHDELGVFGGGERRRVSGGQGEE